jgi:hypothetical protein
MSNVVEFISPTLDGAMQAPGRPDEDLVLGSGGHLFADGGPLATLRLVDRVTTIPACWSSPTSPPNRRQAEHLRSEREHARSGSR